MSRWFMLLSTTLAWFLILKNVYSPVTVYEKIVLRIVNNLDTIFIVNRHTRDENFIKNIIFDLAQSGSI
jgi:hypothetical protein